MLLPLLLPSLAGNMQKCQLAQQFRAKMQLAQRATLGQASVRSRRSVVVYASQMMPEESTAARRAVLLASVLPFVAQAPKALALIPDEEDEELVEKAKANRAKRLAEQRATTRAFMQDEGLANKRLENALIPVQKAVYKLAQSGSQLASGDVKAASRTLSESWVGEFKEAAAKVSTSSPDAMIGKLDSLQSATSKGDLKASKRSFVELVDAVQSWASSSSLAAELKGL